MTQEFKRSPCTESRPPQLFERGGKVNDARCPTSARKSAVSRRVIRSRAVARPSSGKINLALPFAGDGDVAMTVIAIVVAGTGGVSRGHRCHRCFIERGRAIVVDVLLASSTSYRRFRPVTIDDSRFPTGSTENLWSFLSSLVSARYARSRITARD